MKTYLLNDYLTPMSLTNTISLEEHNLSSLIREVQSVENYIEENVFGDPRTDLQWLIKLDCEIRKQKHQLKELHADPYTSEILNEERKAVLRKAKFMIDGALEVIQLSIRDKETVKSMA